MQHKVCIISASRKPVSLFMGSYSSLEDADDRLNAENLSALYHFLRKMSFSQSFIILSEVSQSLYPYVKLKTSEL